MIIAGARLTNTEVDMLASKLRAANMRECASRMQTAYADGERLFHISTQERAAVYEALDDCPPELLPLRANLNELVSPLPGGDLQHGNSAEPPEQHDQLSPSVTPTASPGTNHPPASSSQST